VYQVGTHATVCICALILSRVQFFIHKLDISVPTELLLFDVIKQALPYLAVPSLRHIFYRCLVLTSLQ
jgi:hypothetical protein